MTVEPIGLSTDKAVDAEIQGGLGKAGMISIPLTIIIPAGAPVQLGVVSWGGDRCGADHLPSVFADVARYRDFILDPAPVWAPTKAGASVRIAGTARVGRTLTCKVSDFTPEAGTKVSTSWLIVGAGRSHFGAAKRAGRGRMYKIAKADRGHSIGCTAEASNDGGSLDIGGATTKRRVTR